MRLAFAYVTGPSKFYVKNGFLLYEDIILKSGIQSPFTNLEDKVPTNI